MSDLALRDDGPVTAPTEHARPDRRARALLTLGWVLLAAVISFAAVDVIRAGWAPLIDNAVIASMTVDSVSTDPPLVGMPTSVELEGGERPAHPGPLGFWLLGVPTVLFGEPGEGLVVGAALLSLASLGGTAALLRRGRDPWREGLALLLVGAMVLTLGPGTFVSPFNPHIGVLPVLLGAVATWGVLSGRARESWVVVLAGSCAAQAHVGYVPLVASLVLLTGAGLALEVVRASGGRRRSLTRRTIPVAVALGVLAWIGPIVDQVAGSHNLTLLATSQGGDRPHAGLDHGLDVAVAMTSLPPRWMLGRATDRDLSNPGALRIALSLVAVGAVVGLTVRAARRHDRRRAALGVVALTSVVAVTLTAARMVDPEVSPFFDVESALIYRLAWWPVGVVFALSLLDGLRQLAVDQMAAHRRGHEVPGSGSGAGLVAFAGAVVVVVGALSLGTFERATDLGEYADRETVNAQAIDDLPGSGTVVLRFTPEGPSGAPAGPSSTGAWDLGPDGRYGYAANLVAQLRLRGIEVRFADEPDDGVTFLRSYRDEHPAEGDELTVLYLVGAAALDPPPPGYERISSAGAGPGEPVDPFSLPTAVFVRSSG